MARIQYERPDGSDATREADEINFDAESGHWLVLSEDDEDLIYIPRERVYFVEETARSVDVTDETEGEGW
ncbi:MAG: hypothetical protein ABEJ67_02395 [Halanaeroarchaeum sp.]